MKKKKLSLEQRRDQLKADIRSHSTGVIILYVVLRLIVSAALIWNIIQGSYESAFICVLSLVLFMMPSFIERKLNIDLPNALEVIVLLFIFAAEILGELSSYYITYPHWDTILHTTSGFLTAAVGFAMIDILNRNSRIKFNLSPIFCAVAAFCFSMTIGVLWEFFEFSWDVLFHTDMQKDTIVHLIASTSLDPTASNVAVQISNITEVAVNGQSLGLGGYLDIGLYDTMEDLFVNFIGATVFSILGYFHIKHKGKSKIASRFIPTLNEKTPPAEAPEEN